MHHFIWYFIKGEKICILSFNWYLVYRWFLLPHFMVKIVFILVSYVLNDKFLQLVSFCIKMFVWIISIGIKILCVFSKLVSMPYLLSLVYVHFQLVSKCATLTFFLIGILLIGTPYCIIFVLDKKGENIAFIVLYPFVDDWQKGGELFE